MYDFAEPLSKHDISIIYNHFSGNIPIVENEPVPEDFGLDDNWEIALEEETMNAKKRYRHIFWTAFLTLWLITVVFSGILKEGSVFFLLGSFIVLLWFFTVVMLVMGIDDKIRKKYILTPVKIKAEEYENKRRAYLYWKHQRQIEFWHSLNGYEFELYVGQIFFRNGYEVHNTKLSGDGGIDLIVEKNNERIAIQCKAHKKAVGPSVVRDLYGTMNHFGYTKGILISLNGFTKGVYTFVQDKSIQLLSLDDLLVMSKEEPC